MVEKAALVALDLLRCFRKQKKYMHQVKALMLLLTAGKHKMLSRRSLQMSIGLDFRCNRVHGYRP